MDKLEGNERVPFAERMLATLRAKGDKRLLTTAEVRALTGISPQQWQRFGRNSKFPVRRHIGRQWCVNASELADFLEYLNALHAGMTLSEVAAYARTTTYTLHDLAANGSLPKPIGMLNGRARFARADIEGWQRERLGGLQPPTVAAPKVKKKMTRDRAQGEKHGETKSNAGASC
jgi:predicted DNA-binding transcriptional regulator AlpA